MANMKSYMATFEKRIAKNKIDKEHNTIHAYKRKDPNVSALIAIPMYATEALLTEEEKTKVDEFLQMPGIHPKGKSAIKRNHIANYLIEVKYKNKMNLLIEDLKSKWPEEKLPDRYKSKYEKELENLFNDLVPDHGPSKYKEGEIVRAAFKIAYRWYNDGDTLTEHCESVTSAVNYLYSKVPNIDKFFSKMKVPYSSVSGSNRSKKKARIYSNNLHKMLDFIYEFVSKTKPSEYSINNEDYLNY